MKIEVSENEYNAAIGEALEIIATQRGSAGVAALEVLLANVWDSTCVEGNVFDCLRCLDLATRLIGFCLVIGRTIYGRPSSHPRLDELQALYFRKMFRHPP